MNLQVLFVEAVCGAGNLPTLLRQHAADVRELEEHRFDESYIEFLETQIRLAPRGPEWTKRLNRRRTNLSPFCNRLLLRGKVRIGDADFTVEIDPVAKTVAHWEKYDIGSAASD